MGITGNSFGVQVGPRKPGDRLRNGDTDGMFYARLTTGRVTWYGPYKSLAAANLTAREILEVLENTDDGRLYASMEVGRRYWLEDARRWYVRYEGDSRSASGYEHNPPTEEPFVPDCAPLTRGYFGQVMGSDSKHPANQDVIYNVCTVLDKGCLPGINNSTLAHLDSLVYGTFHSDLTKHGTGANQYYMSIYREGANAYWVPCRQGWSDFTSSLCVDMQGDFSPSVCSYFDRPDTPFPDDDRRQTPIEGSGGYNDVASNGVFLSHIEATVVGTRRRTNILPTILGKTQVMVGQHKGDATVSGTRLADDVVHHTEAEPYPLYDDADIVIGNSVHVADFVTVTIPENTQYTRHSCFNNISLYPVNMGCVPIPGFFGEDTWIGPVQDGAFPNYPAKLRDDTDKRFEYVDAIHRTPIAPQTRCIETDIEFRAVYVVRTDGVGSEVYYKSGPYSKTLAAMNSTFGPQSVYSSVQLPSMTPDVSNPYLADFTDAKQDAYGDYEATNKVGYVWPIATVKPPGVINRYQAYIKRDVTRTLQSVYDEFGVGKINPPDKNSILVNTGFGDMTVNSTQASGGQFPFKVPLNPTDYVIRETFTVTDYPAEPRLLPVVGTPFYTPFPASNTGHIINSTSFARSYTPHSITIWEGGAKKIREPFENGTSLPYRSVDGDEGISWSTPIYGVAGSGTTISVGPMPPKPDKLMFFRGYIPIWFSTDNVIPLIDNSLDVIPDSNLGSAIWRRTLDDGRIIYIGIGQQAKSANPIPGGFLPDGVEFPELDPSAGVLVGFDGIKAIPKTVNKGRKSVRENYGFQAFGPHYATGPYYLPINSDDVLHVTPLPDEASLLPGSGYGNLIPTGVASKPDTSGFFSFPGDLGNPITIGVTSGAELGKLATIRYPDNTDNGVGVTLYTSPQLTKIKQL